MVQRYGEEVLGGAESFTRQMATKLAAKEHDVHVLSSCATSYIDWANVYPPGDSSLEGVTVHRLPVAWPRSRKVFFEGLNPRVMSHKRQSPYYLQREWMRQQGPYVPGLAAWLAEHSAAFDVAIFVTYLYYTTWAGMAAARAPVILHPTAHDEPPIYLPLFDSVFRLADGYGFLTEEEADFVRRRFGVVRPHQVTGMGLDLPDGRPAADARAALGIGEAPYVVYAGRIDPSKGAVDLYNHFVRYKAGRPGPLKLVMLGEEITRLPRHRDVVFGGYVSDQLKNAALAGALALIQPSFYESFSIVLIEAWSWGIPALVQERSEVLRGQIRRSRGGLAFAGYPEFEAALDRLVTDERLRWEMGAAGRRYVVERYSWERVLERYEMLLDRVREGRPGRAPGPAPAAR